MSTPSPPARPLRPAVAEIAQRYRDGHLTYAEFLRLLPRDADRQDDAVAELLDAIVAGSPPSAAEREEHLRLLDELIGRLETCAG